MRYGRHVLAPVDRSTGRCGTPTPPASAIRTHAQAVDPSEAEADYHATTVTANSRCPIIEPLKAGVDLEKPHRAVFGNARHRRRPSLANFTTWSLYMAAII